MPTYTLAEAAQLFAKNKDLGIAEGELDSCQSLENASVHGIGQAEVETRPGVNLERNKEVFLSEAEFQQQVIDLAHLRGWMVYHTHNSRFSESGFPDVLCVRKTEVVVFECKIRGAKLGKGKWNKKGTRWLPGQDEWLMALSQVPGITASEVRPSDWDWIVETLK